MKVYSEAFYKRHLEGSLNSAKEIVPLLLKLVHPSSVIDVGCGLGLWLSIFRDYGIEDICGVDGDYVNRDLLRISHDKFIAHNLNEPLRMSRKYDLVLCLEVAEHIPQDKSETFIGDQYGVYLNQDAIIRLVYLQSP